MQASTAKDQKKWESVCSKCAQCCYEKIDFEGRIYYTEIPCEFLDLETNLCRVYDDRENKRPGCVHLTAENIKQGFLPADCPYVTGIENYPAPDKWDENDPDHER